MGKLSLLAGVVSCPFSSLLLCLCAFLGRESEKDEILKQQDKGKKTKKSLRGL